MSESQVVSPREKPTPQKKVYDYSSLIYFESPQKNSTFGKVITSDIKSSPSYGFGTSDREKEKNVYISRDISKLSLFGKHSANVHYDTNDNFQYKNSEKWSFTNMPEERVRIKPLYDYYTRNDMDINPASVYLKLKPNNNSACFGMENRFSNESKTKVPGPKYEIKENGNFKSSPKFSIGCKIENEKKNIIGCTSDFIGPGSYNTEKIDSISKLQKSPTISFPKKKRDPLINPSYEKHQTYENSKSIGPQILSKKKTLPAHSFGTGKRASNLAYSKHFFSDYAQNNIIIPMPII